jgi:hypothetical protein
MERASERENVTTCVETSFSSTRNRHMSIWYSKRSKRLPFSKMGVHSEGSADFPQPWINAYIWEVGEIPVHGKAD